MGDVEGANSKTFKILEPKRRKQYSESESLRHPLAKGAVRAKEFELTDPELLVKFVNAQTGQVNTAFLHMNSMAISDEEVFTVSRAVPLSSVAKVLDFYGNSVQEATGVLTTERINHGIAKAKCNSLETVSWANNILGPSMMAALSETLVVCRSLHTLDLSNLFEPIADDDGAALMVGLADNRTLQSLNLTGNQLGKNFCWELKQALAKHPKLESLRCPARPTDPPTVSGTRATRPCTALSVRRRWRRPQAGLQRDRRRLLLLHRRRPCQEHAQPAPHPLPRVEQGPSLPTRLCPALLAPARPAEAAGAGTGGPRGVLPDPRGRRHAAL